jgi:hypothetical protein
MATALVRRVSTVDALARDAGLHPDLVRRLIRLGALDPPPRDPAARLARAMRLRRDLGVNVAGAVLACDLLARIEDLEARLHRYEPVRLPEVRTWIPTS